jgi:DNA-binding transcriptional LysR family regulator
MLNGRVRVSAAEGVREAVFAGLGFSVGGSEWMYTPETKSGTVKVVLADWSLPPAELWAVFPSGRQASAKARAFAMFMERQLSEEAEQQRRSAGLN